MAQKVFIIGSGYTAAPYIDERRTAYIYMTREQAEEKVKDTPNTIIIEKEGDSRHFLSYCYAAGAKRIKFRGKYLRIDEKNVERRFYNGDPNADISRYAHTKKKIYLQSLRNCSFIVPIMITNHPSVRAMYAVGGRKGMPQYFFAFTDMDEYKKWEKEWEKTADKSAVWEPLRVDFHTLRRIGKKQGFYLNVLGYRLLMTPKMLKDIERGAVQ